MKKEKENIICPYCESDNVAKERQAGYIIMLSFMLLRLPIPLFKKSYYCFDCGKEWKNIKT
jgi:DNA-directed RNA polymerase subunit RPC12/RpoP